MTKEIKRYYIEINSLEHLKETSKTLEDLSLSVIRPINFQLNKFFYKNIGKKHQWVDRLIWSEENWINHLSDENTKVYVLKYKDDLVGFFELIFHQENTETEIAYFGVLEEYQNQKLGSYLLSEAIKISFNQNMKRVWLHTCSLDHKYALKNYISRGMKIFKEEIVKI